MDGWMNRDQANGKKKNKNEESLREMWNTIKCTNIFIMENTRRQKRTEKKH